MKKEIKTRVTAGVLSAVMLCAAVPVTTAFSGSSAGIVSAAEDDSTTEIYSSGFEDGDVSAFTGRGGVETITATDSQAYSGSYSMCVSDRAKNWNGPQFLLDDKCEAGVQYTVSAAAKTEWYNSIKLSMEYTDASGERHYSNLQAQTSNGDWATFSNVKFSFSEDVSKVYLYFECNDTATMYIDDFEVRTAPVYPIQNDIPSLKDVYANDFKIGTAVTTAELAPQSTKDLIAKHFNSITLGNELKPESILNKAATLASGSNTDPVINLASARTILNYCRDNNIPVRGHVLVWHSQTPDWFFKENFDPNGAWVSKDKMTKRLENYIKTVMETLKKDYPDVEFYAWDVVNEAASDAGTIRDAGSNNEVNGQSAWVKVYGDQSYIPLAFEFAKKYAPAGCKLFYNDYNEYSPNKQAYIISDILKPLVEKNLIDGVGMQSHISMSYPTIDLYKSAMQQYADQGLEVQVTELDVSEKSNEYADQLALAQRYQDVFKMYKEMKDSGVNLSAVVLWGITDSTSWIGGYPLLFDKDYQAKPSYYAVIDTDSEVEKLQTMTAYRYDGTDADLERALEIGTAQYLSTKTGSTNTYFKAAWSDENMIVRIYNPAVSADDKNSYVAIYGNQVDSMGGFPIASQTITSDTAYIDLKWKSNSNAGWEPKNGSTVHLDVFNNDAAWNCIDLAKSFFDMMNESEPIGGGALPTCGIVTLAEQPKYAEATKTETPITIDGDIDAAWADANTIDVNTYSMGNGATAVSKMLWDENYFYVLTEVTDPVLSVASANAYEQDTVEVFFDENNHKTSSYESDDIQCRINYENDKTVTDGRSTDAFLSGTKKTDKGYIVEVAIPYTIGSFHADQIVGFDVQVNDDGTGDGKRTSMANWNDLTGQGYINTSGFGVLKLVGDGTITTDTTVTTTTTGTTSTTTETVTSATTSDSSTNTSESGESGLTLYGDVNMDSRVDITDAVLLNKAVANVVTLGSTQKKNADCDADSEISGNDAVVLLKFLVSIIHTLPSAE